MALAKQDRIAPRSAKELEQKYALGEVFGGGENSYAALSAQINRLNQTLAQFMASTTGKFEEMESNSGTWFYSGVPTLKNQPAVEWDSDELKTKHIGDMYFDNDSTKIYLFKCTETVADDKTVKTFEWVECNS